MSRRVRIAGELLLLALGIAVGLWIGMDDRIHEGLLLPGAWKWLGIFVGGMLYTSVFTSVPGIAVLTAYAGAENALLIALVGGIGSVLGDYILFRFVESELDAHIIERLTPTSWQRLGLRFSPPWRTGVLTVLGAAVVASPLPDELGIALLGLSHLSTERFMLVALPLNALGIFALVETAVLVG